MPRWTPFAIAAAIGGTLWLALVADMNATDSALYTTTQDTEGPFLAFVLAAFAAAPVLLGAVFRDRPGQVALGLLAVPLALAWWTTPRGDGDGLWVFIFPYLVFLAFAAYLLAMAAGSLRAWVERRLTRRPPA